MLFATTCWVAGSGIMLTLGGIHLYYTFFSDKFRPVNEELHALMEQTPMRLTPKTSLWKAWVGFNTSHSIGVIYIGVINLFLALRFPDLLRGSVFLYAFNIAVIGFYLWVARKYWFKAPFTGVLITFVLYVTAAVVALAQSA
jgi:hypothetical protein